MYDPYNLLYIILHNIIILNLYVKLIHIMHNLENVIQALCGPY